MSLNGKDYTERKPFKNTTSYQVGQIRTFGGENYVITAIGAINKTTLGIYAYPATQAIKLAEYKDLQARRERGQVNVYKPGKLVATVKC